MGYTGLIIIPRRPTAITSIPCRTIDPKIDGNIGGSINCSIRAFRAFEILSPSPLFRFDPPAADGHGRSYFAFFFSDFLALGLQVSIQSAAQNYHW